MQMNLQLHHVVSDITGVTGMRSCARSSVASAMRRSWLTFRDVRCKASVETIREALTGNYQPEHVFALRQAIELYDFYQAKVQRLRRRDRAEPPRVADGCGRVAAAAEALASDAEE